MEHALSFITGRKILSQPTHGIEPWTFSLRMKCSTTELCGHIATRPENTLYKQNTYCQIIQQRQQPMTIAWPRSLSRYHKVALCTTMFTCYVGTCTVRLARYAICKSSRLISISRDPVGIWSREFLHDINQCKYCIVWYSDDAKYPTDLSQ